MNHYQRSAKVIGTILGTLLTVTVLNGQPPRSPDMTADQIQQWIQDLDGRSFVGRTRAMKQLLQVGSAGTEALVHANAGSDDGELKARSQTIISRWLAIDQDYSDQDYSKREHIKIEDSLTALAASTDPAVAAVANDFMALVMERYRRILTRLESLGATVEISETDSGRISGVHLQIDEDWTGKQDNLVKVASIRTMQSIAILGNGVEESFLDTLQSFPNLKRLALQDMKITNDGMESLSALNQLESLDLTKSSVGDELGDVLGGLTSLKSLSVQDTLVTDELIPKLIQLPNLTDLSLARTQITESGFVELSKLKTLETLDATTSRFDRESFFGLLGLDNLRSVKAKSTFLSKYDVEDFQIQYPSLKLSIEFGR